LYPVQIQRAKGYGDIPIGIFLYQGQWQLATADTLYSDGKRYRPLRIAFKYLEKQLHTVKEVLALGAGLGSIVSILHSMGFAPQYTLVDIDEISLQWAMELVSGDKQHHITPVCANAEYYIATDKNKYGLIAVDIFTGRQVPAFVISKAFLQHCRDRLKPGGFLVLNYIITAEEEWLSLSNNFNAIFPGNKVLAYDINRIFVASV